MCGYMVNTLGDRIPVPIGCLVTTANAVLAGFGSEVTGRNCL